MIKIAVVDDDQQFTEAITLYLRGRGYTVHGYNSHRDALLHLSENWDVILLDLQLGDGDGMDLLKRIRGSNSQIKSIIFTGYDSLPKRLQSFAHGADDYMKKPIFPSELEARIRRLVKTEIRAHAPAHLDDKRYTKVEQHLLSLLLSAQGSPVSLDTLVGHTERTASAVYTCLCRLKNKVRSTYCIKTAYGRGWYVESCKQS